MKKIYTCAFAILLTGSMVTGQTTTRNTLLEVFTSSTCGPCNPANSHMEGILPSLSNYTVIKYQQNFPSPGDPYNTSESVSRRSYYSINSIPRMEIDGQWDQNAGNFSQGTFNSYQSIASELEITIDQAEYFGDSVFVEYTVTALTDQTSPALRTYAAVTEKETTQNTGNNGETEFQNVFMDMLNSNLIGAITTSTPFNYSQSVSMATTNVEDMGDLRLVVWVQNGGDKVVYQSAWSDITAFEPTSTGINNTNDILYSIYPNPAKDQATIRVKTSEVTNMNIDVYNAIGQKITNVYNGSMSSQKDILVNTANFQSGIYFVKITSGEKVKTVKLNITH